MLRRVIRWRLAVVLFRLNLKVPLANVVDAVLLGDVDIRLFIL